MSPLSKREIAFIRHALGLENAKVGYRNRYLAAGEAIDIGNALVERGMAVNGRKDRDGSRWFIITEDGFKAAAKPGERMDREEAAHMAAISVSPSPSGITAPKTEAVTK